MVLMRRSVIAISECFEVSVSFFPFEVRSVHLDSILCQTEWALLRILLHLHGFQHCTHGCIYIRLFVHKCCGSVTNALFFLRSFILPMLFANTKGLVIVAGLYLRPMPPTHSSRSTGLSWLHNSCFWETPKAYHCRYNIPKLSHNLSQFTIEMYLWMILSFTHVLSNIYETLHLKFCMHFFFNKCMLPGCAVLVILFRHNSKIALWVWNLASCIKGKKRGFRVSDTTLLAIFAPKRAELTLGCRKFHNELRNM